MSKNNDSKIVHELLVLHANADEGLVQNKILPLLDISADQVLLLGSLGLGKLFVRSIGAAIRSSRIVLLILTPDFFCDPTSQYGEALAYFCSLERDGNVIPVIAKSCEIPDHLRMLKCLDISNSRSRGREIKRLNDYLRKTRSQQGVHDGATKPSPLPLQPVALHHCSQQRHNRSHRISRTVAVTRTRRAPCNRSDHTPIKPPSRTPPTLRYALPVTLFFTVLMLISTLASVERPSHHPVAKAGLTAQLPSLHLSEEHTESSSR